MASHTRLIAAVAALLAACSAHDQSITIQPQEPLTTDDLSVEFGSEGVTVTDDPGTAWSYDWYLDGEEQPDLRDRTMVAATRTAKGQRWEVIVSDVRKQGELLEGPTDAVLVQNSLPTATLTLHPQLPDTRSTLEVDVTGLDADRDDVTFSYRWFADGTAMDIDGASVPAELTHKNEVWTVEVIPDDGEQAGEPVTASVTIGNSKPSATSATIAPDPATVEDTLACVAAGWSDDDDDAEQYRVRWLVGPDEIATGPELDASTLTRGMSVRCEATPDDGDDLGTPVTSESLVLSNAPPRLDSVTIAPEDPVVADAIFAAPGTSYDADGDEVTLTYRWFRNGVAVTTLETLPPGRAVKGEEISLEVTPHDGFVAGAVVLSNTLTVGNTAPTVDGVVVDPTDVFTDTVLTASALVTEPDPDAVTVTYDWQVNGSSTGETSDTLDGAAAFDKGDEIVVYATADDGEASSSPVASAKLLVLNSPPTAPELEPDPAEYSAGDEVHCKVATASTDADGDSLTYTFSWTLNGAATSDVAKTVYTGDTFVGDWGEDDVLVCTANVSDGADSATQTMKVILGAKVLLVYDALSGSGVGVKAALEAAGHTVTWSDDPEFLYDGSNPAPDTFDVVFFINGSAGSSDMPSAGQKAIVDFVKAGGGFVYNEPAMSEVSKGHYGVLSTLFVGTSTSSTTGGTLAWTTVGVHPVLDGISSSFSTPKCHVQKATTKTGATLVLKAGSWEGAAVMTFGSGRSVGFYHFGGNSSDCDSTSEITDLYSNAVFWAAGRG